MNNVMEACDKIRDYLSKWYNEVKDVRQYLSDNEDGTKVSYAKHLDGYGLWCAKREFIELNPEYEKFDFDIIIGFDVDVDTWRPPCLNGCCVPGPHAKCRGILVMPVNWEQTRKLALVA
jgi:hypothetical protein